MNRSSIYPDIRVEYHGSICLLHPRTKAIERWLEDTVEAEAQWFGRALVVEPRYVRDITDVAREEGLTAR